MSFEKFLAIAFIYGVAAPLLWLTARRVGLVVDAWIARRWRLLREKLRERFGRPATKQLGGSPRIGE